MAMPATIRRWTAADVRAMPDDGQRYEVIRGELFVTPAPASSHQLVSARLFAQLTTYLASVGRPDTALYSPADISWGTHTLVQPDIFVFPPGELTARWSDLRTLLLAVEILSPSSVRADRFVKRTLYQQQGVATYWVVDPSARNVEVWRLGDETARVETTSLAWQVAPDAPLLTIDLPVLFTGLPE